MRRSSRFSRPAWWAPRCAAPRWGASASLVVALAGCFPERPLSSYREQGEAAPEITSSRARTLVDAGASAPAPAPAPSEPLGPFVAPARPDAGPAPPPLDCRQECECESGAFGALMFCPTPVTYEEAAERCAVAGGALASVDDAERNGWLSARMSELDADDFWLSGTDSDDEGTWRWSDGRVFFEVGAGATIGDAGAPAYAPWDDGQPNDLNGEDCMRSTGGVWRDLDCSEAIAFVCQG